MSKQHPFGTAPPRFRLPDGTRVGVVALLVTDLVRSIDYYERVLGLQVHQRSVDRAVLGAPDAALLSLQTTAGVRPARKGAFGLYHFAVLLPERSALGRFAAHVSRLGIAIGMADHAVSEALYLTDPDGLGIEVYSDRPPAEWPHRNRELVMTVDPLDHASLIDAGGGQAWDGVPPRTTIGHVHLHVGSLEQADAFYHAGLGFDKTMWSFPSALFLAAGGYHHHLGTNTWAPGPAAAANEARLLEWQLVVPDAAAVGEATKSLRSAGYDAHDTPDGSVASDPWGVRLRLSSEQSHAAIERND